MLWSTASWPARITRRASEPRTRWRESEAFAALWTFQTVYGKTRDATELGHPDVGRLWLTSQAFDVRGAQGQLLVVYQPEPGNASAEALTLLGTLHATSRQSSGR